MDTFLAVTRLKHWIDHSLYLINNTALSLNFLHKREIFSTKEHIIENDDKDTLCLTNFICLLLKANFYSVTLTRIFLASSMIENKSSFYNYYIMQATKLKCKILFLAMLFNGYWSLWRMILLLLYFFRMFGKNKTQAQHLK